MGVSYFNCSNCKNPFSECVPYVSCQTCEVKICPDCMEDKNIKKEMANLNNPKWNKEEFDQCPFCSHDIVPDETLFNFLLNDLKITRDQLLQKYKSYIFFNVE